MSWQKYSTIVNYNNLNNPIQNFYFETLDNVQTTFRVGSYPQNWIVFDNILYCIFPNIITYTYDLKNAFQISDEGFLIYWKENAV